nr:hypothetical protein [Tanacetum cinerariifolium]
MREEWCIEVCEEQRQNMENTMLVLVKIYQEKELYCMHDNVDDLIESALNFKLLSINSQRLNKENQEAKNVVEQPAERRTRIIESLQNFRVIHKSSTSLKNTSQISLVHAIAAILSTKEPKYSPSIGYEHLSTSPEMKLDEVTKSSAKNLLPIPNNDDLTSSDDESLFEEDVPIRESNFYSNPLFDDDEINSDELELHVESNFFESLSNHDDLIDSSQKIDYLEEFSGELAHINPEITESDFDFEEEIHLIENLLEEINIVTETDAVLPPSVENDDDSEEDIHFLEELLRDNSIPLTKNESLDSDHQDDPSFPRPPPEPPDDEFDFELDTGDKISVVMNDNDELECLDPRDEFDDDDYSSFIFLIYSKVFSLLLSAKSEDIIFDPGISI